MRVIKTTTSDLEIEMESVLDADAASEGRVERLERQGLLRRGKRRTSKSLLETRPPRQRKGTSAVNELLKERRSGR